MPDLALTGRSFLTIHDFAPAEIVGLLDFASELKAKQKAGESHALLAGRAVAMIFMKTSTRTRMSFEIGIAQLGAQPMFLSANDIQLRVGETIRDTANVMSRYVDAIMIRTFAQQDVEDLAHYGQVPVINGLTDSHHPCQGMADALTIREHCGRLRAVKLVYIGDGNNVAHSLAEVGAKTGMHVVVCTPADYEPDAAIIARAQEDAKQTGATIQLSRDVASSVAGADVIYTDTFTSMGQEAEHDSAPGGHEGLPGQRRHARAGRPPGEGHALPARPLGRGDHRRGAVLAQLGGVRPGREPPARPEGHHGGRHPVKHTAHPAPAGAGAAGVVVVQGGNAAL